MPLHSTLKVQDFADIKVPRCLRFLRARRTDEQTSLIDEMLRVDRPIFVSYVDCGDQHVKPYLKSGIT